MAPSDHDGHVSSGELDRTVAGFTTAMEIGFKGVKDAFKAEINGVHRRLDDMQDRSERIETTVRRIGERVERHDVAIEHLEGGRKPSTDDTVGLPPITSATVNDDANAAITFGDIRRVQRIAETLKPMVLPILGTVGGAVAAWFAKG